MPVNLTNTGRLLLRSTEIERIAERMFRDERFRLRVAARGKKFRPINAGAGRWRARTCAWWKRAERWKNEGTNDDLVACEIIRRRIARKK